MKKVLLPLLLCASLKGAAQLPQLVSDLNPGAAGSAPFGLAVFKDWLYFGAATPGKGVELWRYDGGGGTPVLAQEINAGSGDGLALISLTPPAELNGRLYFAGTNAGGAGLELYSYDGFTPATLAADIAPGSSGSLPAELTVLDNKLFFAANTSANGYELYSFVGSGAPVLYDVYPGSTSSAPANLTVFNGRLYFSADMPGYGNELCVYDPAANAVSLAADIVPGAVGSRIVSMEAVGNVLYFTAVTAATGRELWRYDGTGASLVKDLAPGMSSGQSNAPWLGSYDGNLYFGGTVDGNHYALYRYDPVADTVEEASTIRQGSGDISFSWPYVFENRLYFGASDGSNGAELWRYDGSTAAMVSDINPGGADSEPAWMCNYYGRLYFSATSAGTGRELYRLQGAGGVQNVAFDGSATVAPNPASGDAQLLLSLKGPRRCSFSLTDVSGRTVWQQLEALYESGAHRIQLPVAAVSPGLYFYAVREGGRLLLSGRLEKR